MSTRRASLGFTLFAKSEHNLIRLSSNNGIKNGSLVIIVGISKRVGLRFENESSRFDLTFHADRINAVQCVGVPQPRAGFGYMIDDEKSPPRFQGIEERSVKRRHVRRSQKGIVQIVVILRRPNEIELSRMRKFASEPVSNTTFV